MYSDIVEDAKGAIVILGIGRWDIVITRGLPNGTVDGQLTSKFFVVPPFCVLFSMWTVAFPCIFWYMYKYEEWLLKAIRPEEKDCSALS